MSQEELRRPTACPECGGTTILRIFYGYPTWEAWALVEDGQATLGGCFVSQWAPDWQCGVCRHEWFDPDDPVKQEMERLLANLRARASGRR
ncbi:MAG: hypothetical protein FJX77_15665 [Armatimonadetes bacterium]|nr:hypothetical protein [Armatimonadota bacterium]